MAKRLGAYHGGGLTTLPSLVPANLLEIEIYHI